MAIDPVQQAERFLIDYVQAFADLGAWAKSPPRHSISFDVIRALFTAGLVIEDLERILQGMIAEKVKPKSYPYLLAIIKSRIEDLQHERRSASAKASS